MSSRYRGVSAPFSPLTSPAHMAQVGGKDDADKRRELPKVLLRTAEGSGTLTEQEAYCHSLWMPWRMESYLCI